MKLKDIFEVNLTKIPSLTIATEKGERWLCYFDGAKWVGENYEDYFDREVKELWFRGGRKNKEDIYGNPILPLEKGLGIIIEGDEDGEI